MNKKVVKWITLGVGLYVVFAVLVLTYYEDDPSNMGWQDREAFNRKYINSFTIGDQISKDDVITLLGIPDITEAKTKANDDYQVLFYRTQHVTSDGITTKDECTPLLLKNGILTAWGEAAYQTYLEL